MQETRVWSLIWEDPTCSRATRPEHNYYPVLESLGIATTEPMRRNYWSRPRACPLQHEKTLQWTAHSWPLESSPCLCNYGKARVGSKTQQSQKSNKWRKFIKKKSIQVGITTNGVGYSLSQSLCATLPDEFRFSIFFKAVSHWRYFLLLFLQSHHLSSHHQNSWPRK